MVGFWANTALTEQAGIDVEAIETWEQLENAVVTLREAGITPVVVGAKDGWPMHFYWDIWPHAWPAVMESKPPRQVKRAASPMRISFVPAKCFRSSPNWTPFNRDS